MTIKFTARAQRITSLEQSDSPEQSGRRLAGMVTAGAAALALVLGAALPAKADNKDDLAKALLGALVVGVIVTELNDRDRDREHGWIEPVKHKRVPSSCEIAIQGAHRTVSLYPESCLRREGFDFRLPRGCATSARIFGREDRVYSAQCLREAGFRVRGY